MASATEADQLAVTKLALQAMNERFDNVSATTDDLPGPEQIALIFDDELDLLVKEHPWIFSLRHEVLEQLTVDDAVSLPPHWTLALPYPTDCDKVWELLNPLGRDKHSIPFRVVWLDYDNDSTDEQIILCNYDEIMAEFCSSTVTLAEAGPLFKKALAHRLAARTCLAVTGNKDLSADLVREAELLVLKAASEEASAEGVDVDRDRDPDWIEARG